MIRLSRLYPDYINGGPRCGNLSHDGLTIGVSAPRQFGLQGQLGWAGDNKMGNWAAYRDTRAAQFGYDIIYHYWLFYAAKLLIYTYGMMNMVIYNITYM